MKLKQIILSSFLVLLTVFGLNFAVIDNNVSAGSSVCGQIQILPCTEDGTDLKSNNIWKIIVMVINILTAGIVVAAIGGFVFAGVLYSSAGGNADNIKKAKDIMQNIAMGLLAYAAMYSLLNFIVPGGMF